MTPRRMHWEAHAVLGTPDAYSNRAARQTPSDARPGSRLRPKWDFPLSLGFLLCQTRRSGLLAPLAARFRNRPYLDPRAAGAQRARSGHACRRQL